MMADAPIVARDRQRQRVYDWEERVVAPHGGTRIAFAQAQGMVDAIWSECGLRYPPRVERLPGQARALLADASRLVIRLPARTPAWCLLHEVAHAMASSHDGATDRHGPRFVGLYVQLLERYMRLPKPMLLASLAACRIAVDPQARPLFLDGAAA